MLGMELRRYPKMDDQMEIQLAASQGIRSMESLIGLLSNFSQHKMNPHPQSANSATVDCTKLTDMTVSNFKKVISLLNRSGHARFRRAPIQTSPPTSSCEYELPAARRQTSPCPVSVISLPIHQVPLPLPPSFVQSHPNQSCMTLDFTKPSILSSSSNNNANMKKRRTEEIEFTNHNKDTFSVSSSSSFMSSAITGGDGSVNNGKQLGPGSLFLITPPPAAIVGNTPTVSTIPTKKRCLEHDQSETASGMHSISGSGQSCHCSISKKRYIRSSYRYLLPPSLSIIS